MAGPVLRLWMNERQQSPQPVARAAVPKEEERCDPACLGMVVVWPEFFLAKVCISLSDFKCLYLLEWWLFLTVSWTWLQGFIRSRDSRCKQLSKQEGGNFLNTNVNWLDVSMATDTYILGYPGHFTHPLCYCHCGFVIMIDIDALLWQLRELNVPQDRWLGLDLIQL